MPSVHALIRQNHFAMLHLPEVCPAQLVFTGEGRLARIGIDDIACEGTTLGVLYACRQK